MPSKTAYGLIAGLLWMLPAIAAESQAGQFDDPELNALLKKAAHNSDSFQDHFDAWVWLADMSKRLEKKIPDAEARIKLLKNVHYEATRARLEPEMVLSIIQVESNFNPYAISSAGARGLMQVMPFWMETIGKTGDSLFNTQTNLRYGCTILRYYLDKENGHRPRALARYNGSSGKPKYPATVYQVWNRHWYPQ